MLGGYEGRLRNDKRVYLTLFAGSDLQRPTLARNILAQRSSGQGFSHAQPRPWIVTFMGGTEIKAPTLVEEYLDLRDLVSGGQLSWGDVDRYLAQVDQGQESSYVTVTLFGGLSEDALPTENREIEALALQRHLGNLSERCGEILQMGIGLSHAERRAVIRKAVMTSA